jgi:methionine sulfoxide reductase catalytic subunit
MRESEATPEAMFHDRRRVVQAMGFGALIAAAVPGDITVGKARAAAERDPSAGLYPAKRNEHCTPDRPITDEKLSTTYNYYYYEFEEDDRCGGAGAGYDGLKSERLFA